MSKASTWLSEYGSNVYSQTGEDGIIAKILEVIPENDKWCVEFGAWDGLVLTNTRNLIESQGYSAVLIEADRRKFHDLQENYCQRDNVITMNQLVGFADDDNLDQILGNTPVPVDFDLLSIDIDGNDYHVWKAIEKCRPKTVVIEFNPTIPTDVRFVQSADPSINQGASLLSLVELGKEKGYELVSVLPFNALFVKQEYYQRFQIESNAPHVLRTNMDDVTYLFSGYDGSVFLRGCCKLPWHGIYLKESRLQHLPRLLRTYPGHMTRTQGMALRLYRLFREPRRLRTKIGALIRRLARCPA